MLDGFETRCNGRTAPFRGSAERSILQAIARTNRLAERKTNGEIAAALMENADELLEEEPRIEEIDVLAAKHP